MEKNKQSKKKKQLDANELAAKIVKTTTEKESNSTDKNQQNQER